MSSCSHTTLELLPEPAGRVRCRHCHLTLPRDDVKDGFCPECFDTSGLKRYEFEELVEEKSGVARYRCEECGIIIQSR
jgi:hypothetical protein